MSIEERLEDPYAVLGISDYEAPRDVISKAARKLGLKYHPDKNPDPSAADLFLLVQKAKEILLDEKRRKEIDDKRKAVSKRKLHDDERNAGMDGKRRKFRDDLAARMASAKSTDTVGGRDSVPSKSTKSSRKEDMAELEKMRKANLEKMREASSSEAQNREDNRRAKDALLKKSASEKLGYQVKIKWKKSSVSHSDDSLYRLFKPFGEVETVELIAGKGGTAIITMASEEAAQSSVSSFDDSPEYRVNMLKDEKGSAKRAAVFSHMPDADASLSNNNNSNNAGNAGAELNSKGFSLNGMGSQAELVSDMKRAMERQKVIDAMRREEEGEGEGEGNMEGNKSGNGNATDLTDDEEGEAVPAVPLPILSYAELVAKEESVLARMVERKNKVC